MIIFIIFSHFAEGLVQKMLEKMRRNPHEWRIAQLETVAAHYGIKVP